MTLATVEVIEEVISVEIVDDGEEIVELSSTTEVVEVLVEGPQGPPGAGGGMAAVQDDPNPALGGNLDAGTHYIDLAEISAPASPGANRARLFVQDNGAGKTQLCILFSTGAVTVLATED